MIMFLEDRKFHKEYIKRQAESGLKKGDHVRIISKCGSYVQGWNMCWINNMDLLVGRKGRIASIPDGRGVEIEIEDPFGRVDPGVSGLFFPYFVLEKIDDYI